MTVVNGVRLVSNSEVQDFKDCPRKWWLAWVRGLQLKVAKPSAVRDLGTLFHQALAPWYVPELEGPVDPRVTLENLLREDYDATYGTYGSIEEIDAKAKLARAMVEGYMKWLEETGVDSELEFIASETYVEATLVRDVKLIAKLDARVQSRVTGRRLFIDHKTVGSLEDTDILGRNQQMLHYHLIEFLNTATDEPRCDGALYNMAKRSQRTRAAKPPFYRRYPIDHNIHELRNYFEQLVGVVLDMDHRESMMNVQNAPHQRAVPSRPSRDCAWKCQFNKICRMFDDGSRVEAAIELYYEVRDPLSYYEGKEKSVE